MPYQISSNESRKTGFKVVRNSGIIDRFDLEEFLDFCREERPDILRLKVDVRDERIFRSLARAGMPYELFTINTRYTYRIDPDFDYFAPVDRDMVGKPVTPELQPLFRNIVEKVLDTRGWYAYRGEILDTLIPAGMSRQIAIDYFCSFSEGGNRYAWLLFVKGECVGVYMGQVEGRRMHGTLYGILSEFRSSGYSRAMYGLMYHECQRMGLEDFAIEVHIQNHHSMEAARRSHMKPEDTFFNLTVFPLLTLAQCRRSEIQVGVPEDHSADRESRPKELRKQSYVPLTIGMRPERGERMVALKGPQFKWSVDHFFRRDTLIGVCYHREDR